jgi:hypothetical protein
MQFLNWLRVAQNHCPTYSQLYSPLPQCPPVQNSTRYFNISLHPVRAKSSG